MDCKQRLFITLAAFALGVSLDAGAQVLPEAVAKVQITLVAKPTSRPMSVAYVPDYSRYYIADGGLGAIPDQFGISMSKSEIHVYSAEGKHLQSVRAGLDNRSIYFNPNTRQLESITYNISSGAGFMPNSGIFSVKLDADGQLTGKTDEIVGHNPAFGDYSTMPGYDPAADIYYAKQRGGGKVLLVKAKEREAVGEIELDLPASGAKGDEVSDYFVAYTGITGEELALLDIDHKAVLVFDRKGRFVGKSALPASMKLRANNHYSGLGYANGLFFVYHEPEGEFGTYYGFRVSDQAQ
jgi:hypothetical protein